MRPGLNSAESKISRALLETMDNNKGYVPILLVAMMTCKIQLGTPYVRGMASGLL